MNELPKITSAYLILTHDCNMKCRYCFVHQALSYMSYQTAKDATDFLAKNAEESGAIPSIIFFGGEPLLCWDNIIKPLVKYIREFYPKGFQLSITTNGILLTQARLNFMKQHNVHMMLSADGSCEAENYNRPLRDGRNSFDVLEPKLQMISKVFPDTWFRSTLIPETCKYMIDGVELAEQSGFSTYFAMPDEFGVWNENDIDILREQVRRFGDYFISRCKTGVRPIRFTIFETTFSYILDINYAIRNNRRRDFDCCRGDHRCGLGGGCEAGISPTGKLYSCQDVSSLDDVEDFFYIGDIYRGSDDEKRRKLIGCCNSRECTGYNCQSCRLDRICDGGCVVNNYLINGDMRKVPYIHCQWCSMLLDEAIRVVSELGNNNETFLRIWKEATQQ